MKRYSTRCGERKSFRKSKDNDKARGLTKKGRAHVCVRSPGRRVRPLRAPRRPRRGARRPVPHPVARKSSPATIADSRVAPFKRVFFWSRRFTRGLTEAPERRDRCDAHVIGCWYGAAHLQRVTRCPQLLSGHRRGFQVLRCWRTPHSRPQANCPRPRCIFRCEERLCIRSACTLFNSVGASIGSTS